MNWRHIKSVHTHIYNKKHAPTPAGNGHCILAQRNLITVFILCHPNPGTCIKPDSKSRRACRQPLQLHLALARAGLRLFRSQPDWQVACRAPSLTAVNKNTLS